MTKLNLAIVAAILTLSTPAFADVDLELDDLAGAVSPEKVENCKTPAIGADEYLDCNENQGTWKADACTCTNLPDGACWSPKPVEGGGHRVMNCDADEDEGQTPADPTEEQALQAAADKCLVEVDCVNRTPAPAKAQKPKTCVERHNYQCGTNDPDGCEQNCLQWLNINKLKWQEKAHRKRLRALEDKIKDLKSGKTVTIVQPSEPARKPIENPSNDDERRYNDLVREHTELRTIISTNDAALAERIEKLEAEQAKTKKELVELRKAVADLEKLEGFKDRKALEELINKKFAKAIESDLKIVEQLTDQQYVIDRMMGELIELQAKVAANKEAIDALNSRIDTVEGDIAGIKHKQNGGPYARFGLLMGGGLQDDFQVRSNQGLSTYRNYGLGIGALDLAIGAQFPALWGSPVRVGLQPILGAQLDVVNANNGPWMPAFGGVAGLGAEALFGVLGDIFWLGPEAGYMFRGTNSAPAGSSVVSHNGYVGFKGMARIPFGDWFGLSLGLGVRGGVDNYGTTFFNNGLKGPTDSYTAPWGMVYGTASIDIAPLFLKLSGEEPPKERPTAAMELAPPAPAPAPAPAPDEASEDLGPPAPVELEGVEPA